MLVWSEIISNNCHVYETYPFLIVLESWSNLNISWALSGVVLLPQVIALGSVVLCWYFNRIGVSLHFRVYMALNKALTHIVRHICFFYHFVQIAILLHILKLSRNVVARVVFPCIKWSYRSHRVGSRAYLGDCALLKFKQNVALRSGGLCVVQFFIYGLSI